jgi:hypothetical protein
MLMLMKSQAEAMRALAYTTAAALDFAHKTKDKTHQAFVDLMIPVVKGWCTETGIEVASLGVQVHGGMGFVEETGAAQYLRDARITTIYEGTTGIQAMDLVGRKIAREGGATAKAWIAELKKLDASSPAIRDPQGPRRRREGGRRVRRLHRRRERPARAVRRRGAVPQADGHRRRRLADGAGARWPLPRERGMIRSTRRRSHRALLRRPRPRPGARLAQHGGQRRARRDGLTEDQFLAA